MVCAGTRWGWWGTLLLGATLGRAFSPQLNYVTPQGGQRGSELDVQFHGARLEDATEVVFYSPGFEVLKLQPATPTNALTARWKIAPDCRIGEHLLRVRTLSGVSEVRSFYVSPFPNLPEQEPNNERAQAQKVPLPGTVNGVVTADDLDFFAVEVRQGQRLSAEVEAMRLGRAAFDAALSILEADGRILAACDDTALLAQDPFVSIVAPKDGTYLVLVHETTFGGSGDYRYRLHVGSFARPSAVYPAGGRTGEVLHVKFLGDAAADLTQAIQLPEISREKFGAIAELAGVASPSPNWLRVSPFPNVLESGTNSSRETATPAGPPPVALNGIVSQAGQHDWFRFPAKKGQPLEVHVYARRLRSPLDPVLEIFNPGGQSLVGSDDAVGLDSYVKFTPPEDGEFFLRVKDQLESGGPDHVYRVELAPVQPALSLSIPQVARNDSQSRQFIAVPRGNRFATLVAARRANFGGDLVFKVDGLPPGVTLHADTMAGSIDRFPVVFEAAPEAPLGGRLLRLTATQAGVTNGIAGAFAHDLEFTYGPNNSVFYGARAESLFVGVTKEVPFRLRIEPPKAPLVQAGSRSVRVVAERAPGFDAPIQVQMVWNPPGLSSQPELTLPKGQSHLDYPLNAAGDAPTRAWQIAVLGSATVDGGTAWASSPLTRLEVAPAFVLGKIETVAVEPGRATNLVCKLDPQSPFEGKATLRLLGLPDRIAVPELQISRDDKEAVFPVTVATNCPTGTHRSLFCSLVVVKDGETVSQTLAGGGVLRVVPPKKVEAKPATLEAKK